MGVLYCCEGHRTTRRFKLLPQEGYKMAILDYLEKCPVCGHTVAQITRIDQNDKVSVCRKINKKARELFDRVKASIIEEELSEKKVHNYNSKSSLMYNEYGNIKKCYSNLSSLKIGLFENKELNHKKIS